MRLFVLAAAALLALCDVAHADSDALWKIVSEKCEPNWREYGEAKPCALVDSEMGYAILKDLAGQTQFLLIPTAKITGIESPALLGPKSPNYFAAAWTQRHFAEALAGETLPRTAWSLAVNSTYGRSQNQLHIHIDCVAPAVRDAVQRNVAALGADWAAFPEPLAGHQYRALRVDGEVLTIDPFKRLADGVQGAREDMGDETLAVIGAALPDGKPAFVVLADKADLATLDRGSAEELQDHSCALAKE